MAGNGKALTAEDIEAFDDRKVVKVKVPEWGGRTVYLKTMTGRERDSWEMGCIDPDTGRLNTKRSDFRAALVVRCLCDQSGKRLFTDSQSEVLGRKNAKAIDRLFETAQSLNKISDKDIKEYEGN